MNDMTQLFQYADEMMYSDKNRNAEVDWHYKINAHNKPQQYTNGTAVLLGRAVSKRMDTTIQSGFALTCPLPFTVIVFIS